VDVIEAITKRRSVRSFQPRDIPGNVADRLLECAILAPSGGNRQPWFFYVVHDAPAKQRLVDAAYGQSFVAQAPLVIVVCADPARSGARYGVRGSSLYSIQDTAAAVQNMLLAATSMGYGTCWIGAFDEHKVAEVIACPEDLRPVAMVLVGYAAEEPKTPKRRNISEVANTI
jgi:nitroreductase